MTKAYKVMASALNIREGPGTEYRQVGQVPFGQVVTVPDVSGWVPILVEDAEDGKAGQGVAWVAAKYLQEYVEPAITETGTEPAPATGKATGKSIVARAETQNGKRYVFGYEVNLDDPDPDAFDCSELVQWVCHQEGVSPEMPDGAANQRDHCQKYDTMIPISEARQIPGTLLFRISSAGNHVVIVESANKTIEAMGSAYGVRNGTINGRTWTHAAKIPGVSYE